MPKKKEAEHKETRRLVGIIDDQGTRLSRSEIDFIANIIDSKQKTFTEQEALRVVDIHERRVVNGKPDYDD